MFPGIFGVDTSLTVNNMAARLSTPGLASMPRFEKQESLNHLSGLLVLLICRRRLPLSRFPREC
eukprot:2259818-Pyramimonas_sp.AAC.1